MERKMKATNLLTLPKARKRIEATTEKKVGYYVRVSTEEQAENPEGSIKNQEERMNLALRFKNANGPYGKLVHVFTDTRTGKDMKRPELQKLFKAIEAGEVNLVMVSELSRLSRSIKDFSQIWEFMQAHGCGFMSLRENFDTSTAAGEMMLYTIANFAQFERRQTGERVAANFLSRAQRGLWNGGGLPLGYTTDHENRGSLKIVDTEAHVVRIAFQALIDQGSVSAAAKWLNREGYSNGERVRRSGGRPRNRNFSFDSLYRLLSNPCYIAVRQIRTEGVDTQLVPAAWPALIDPLVFDTAQKVLRAGRMQKTGRESRYPYLLTSRIICGQCKAPLIGLSAHGSTTKVPYYGHGKHQKREYMLNTPSSERCSPYRIPGKKLEARVWDEVVALIEKATHRSPLFQALKHLGDSQTDRQAIAHQEKDLAAIGEKLASLARRITDLPAGVPAEPFYDEMKRLAESQKLRERELDAAKNENRQQAIASETEYSRLLESLKAQLNDISPDSKRRVIHALVQQVVITPTGFDLLFHASKASTGAVGQTKKGEAFASPSFLLGKNYFVPSSIKQLNGWSDRD